MTANRPKCLLEFGGRALIDWQLDALASAGIEEAVVVVGFGAARVCRSLERRDWARTFYNPFFHVAGNLASLWLIREEMREDFIILNGDTLLSPDTIRRLMREGVEPINVTIDRKPSYDHDTMKVRLAGSRLLAMSKLLPVSHSDAEPIGMLSCRDEGVWKFREAVEKTLSEPSGISKWYLSVVDALAPQTNIGTVCVGDDGWAELNHPFDVPIVEALAQRLNSERPLWHENAERR